MDLKLYPVEDLLEELVRRDAIAILQTTQRIDGLVMMRHIGASDDVRATSIEMCQRMSGRAVADAVDVQHIAHRKFKTSRSEEIMLTLLLVKTPAIKALLEKEQPKPDWPQEEIGEGRMTDVDPETLRKAGWEVDNG